MKILLDSNAYTRLSRGHDEVSKLVRDADEVLLSAVVVGELLFGFYNGTRLEKNLTRLVAFLNRPRVSLLPVSLRTARHYGEISAALRAKGHPISTNDIWIAAHAFQTGAELVSADRDFQAVEGLRLRQISPS